MDSVKDVAELINVMTDYGYRDLAKEHAAIYAMNSVCDLKRGTERMRFVEDALVDLIVSRAVFNASGAMKICLLAFNAIDNAAETGVELSVQDAINEALEAINV